MIAKFNILQCDLICDNICIKYLNLIQHNLLLIWSNKVKESIA